MGMAGQTFFIANDGESNRLWINKQNGTYREESLSRNVAMTVMGKAYAGMGVAIGDTTNRGRLDLFVTHLGSESNTLWRQESPGQFQDRTHEANLYAPRWRGTGFGTLMGDFENKGSLDIAVVNGRVFTGSEARGHGPRVLGDLRRPQSVVRQRWRRQVPRCFPQAIQRFVATGPWPVGWPARISTRMAALICW